MERKGRNGHEKRAGGRLGKYLGGILKCGRSIGFQTGVGNEEGRGGW